MVGIIPARVWGAPALWPNCWDISPARRRRLIKSDGRVYLGPFGHVHPGPMEKYKRANPKKERDDIWRSTDGQIPKRKELIFDKAATCNLSQKGKNRRV